ncbi:MAG TPA: prephenate dehydrogenase/arogenate dehydrogenase family protein [Solirubrobacteraceae bacterium]|nr:prephenate dehydrogenase/arogenate dehydrogenase family protein [Solirubrobacteraceae bacterium]
MRIAVVGLGLIGGSVALAGRSRFGASVIGYDLRQAAAEAALSRGAVTAVADSLAEAVREADAVFVAVPVGALAETVAEVLSVAPGDCVVTDVGSTKREVAAANPDPRFVGGHPLAGAETSGIEHAREDLFEGATWYLTPGAATSGVLYERLHRLLTGLGARPAAIDPDSHDAILGTVSHLPHVLANVLVEQAARVLAAGGERLPATGPSFRDATRVAGSPSAVWTDIYLSNADALRDAIAQTTAALAAVARALDERDSSWLEAWNDRAAAERRRLLEAQLAGGTLFQLHASVPNRPGVVAELALELGRAGVNIADMALYPAPDMSEGVVALWIAGEQPAGQARELISGLGFPVSTA